MIQINPLKSYIDGGVRAALTTPPSASLVFDLPGKAIWVKGVKLKGTDHTYTFSHDNYITLTNTPDSNESEDIKIGVNTSALKSAIDTTYGVVSTTANGLAPKFTSGNKLAAAAATTYYFLGWAGSTLKWYQAPFRNIRINSETTDCLGVNNTDPLIIGSGNGISVTWDSTNKKIIITNTKPDINHNTDTKVALSVTTLNKNYAIILKGNDSDEGNITTVNFSTYLKFNPSTKQLTINGSKVITATDIYTGSNVGLVPAATSAQLNYYLRGDGAWVNIATEMAAANTWRPIKVENTDALGSGTNTGTLSFIAGTGITLAWDTTNKRIIITNSSPDVNHNTDETVRQVPKTDDVNRPLMMINGSTSAGEQINTSMFSTGIYANASTKMITANGFIKAGSSDNYVLLGDGGHKAESSLSVNYASSAESASSATRATNLTPENTPHYFRDPTSSTWRGGMFWGSNGNESMSFVVAHTNTRFQFVGGSDIANWTSSTWQNVTPYLTIYSSGIVTSGSVTATNGFIKAGSSDNYVLLGGGNHKALSDFSMSEHTHIDTFCVTNDSNYVGLSFRDSALSKLANKKYIECWDSAGGWWNWVAGKWIKAGSNDSYVLLGGGGHKLISDFAASSHAHNYMPWNNVSSLNANDVSPGWYNCYTPIANAAHTNHSSLLYVNNVGTPYQLQIPDSNVLYIYKRWYSGDWSAWSKISAGYADLAGNADTVDGLHVHSGRNNEANKIVRTDASGYILAGWINTTSGDMGTTAAIRVYCSDDAYIRYKTLANFSSDIAGQLYWANVKVSTSSNAATSPTFGSLWINNSYFFKLSGTTFTCQGGTTFTLPSSSLNTNTALLWTTASDGTRDTGIFYNSSDFAFIANSNDHGAVFAVYDTDVTQDFEAGVREISVPGNGGALWARGGFSKNGSSDSYVLLGGGGHKLISDFSMSHSHPYLPLSGGTMTGDAPITFQRNRRAINFSNNDSLKSVVQFMTSGNEALVFANQYPDTSYMFFTGIELEDNKSDWYNIGTPDIQIKRKCLYVNQLIGNGVIPSYNLYVNGTTYVETSLNLSSLKLSYSNTSLDINTPYGHAYVGPMNGSYCHIYTDIDGGFYFNKDNLYANGNKILTAGNYSSYALPLSGGTLTGMLRVNALIFGYMYGTSNNRAAFMLDKPGSYYTGVGANGSENTILFSACNGDGTWVDYKQYWVFKGDVTASNFYSSSDIRLKNNINNISKSIRSFNWKESGLKAYGLIAQEIENEYPELISSNDNGYKSINYTSALCMLVAKLENGLDELKEKVKLLEDKLRKYENTL